MRLLRLYGFLVAALLLLTSCGTVRLDDTQPNRSLVFAYFDFSEVEMYVNWGKIKQVSPVIDKPFLGLGYMRNPGESGKYTALFWNEELENGSYQIVTIGGLQTLFLRHANLTLDLGEMGKNVTAVRIDKPGIYFLGAYRYHPTKSTWSLGRGRFELVPIQSPSQTELLKSLLEIAKGTSWESRIQEQLRQGSL